jgi:hypothetical protein
MEYEAGCRELFLHAWIESQRAAIYQVAERLGLQPVEAPSIGVAETPAGQGGGAA